MGAGQARLQDPPHPPYTCPSLEPHPAPSPLMAMVTAGPGPISTIFTNHSEAWGGGVGGQMGSPGAQPSLLHRLHPPHHGGHSLPCPSTLSPQSIPEALLGQLGFHLQAALKVLALGLSFSPNITTISSVITKATSYRGKVFRLTAPGHIMCGGNCLPSRHFQRY